MCMIRSAVLGLCITLIAAVGVQAQEQQRQPRRPAAGLDQAGGPLVPKAVADKLDLSAEQKEKVARIEKEFADKAKDSETKARELMEKARQDKDRAAYQQAQEKLAEARKARATYESQVLALLTDAQKKTFEQLATAQRRPGAAPGQAAGQFLPVPLQERLNLTAEQKEKLNQLQKEFETKALQVLTEEQRKQYEQFKKGRTRQPEQPRQRQSVSGTDASFLLSAVTQRPRFR